VSHPHPMVIKSSRETPHTRGSAGRLVITQLSQAVAYITLHLTHVPSQIVIIIGQTLLTPYRFLTQQHWGQLQLRGSELTATLPSPAGASVGGLGLMPSSSTLGNLGLRSFPLTNSTTSLSLSWGTGGLSVSPGTATSLSSSSLPSVASVGVSPLM